MIETDENMSIKRADKHSILSDAMFSTDAKQKKLRTSWKNWKKKKSSLIYWKLAYVLIL